MDEGSGRGVDSGLGNSQLTAVLRAMVTLAMSIGCTAPAAQACRGRAAVARVG